MDRDKVDQLLRVEQGLKHARNSILTLDDDTIIAYGFTPLLGELVRGLRIIDEAVLEYAPRSEAYAQSPPRR